MRYLNLLIPFLITCGPLPKPDYYELIYFEQSRYIAAVSDAYEIQMHTDREYYYADDPIKIAVKFVNKYGFPFMVEDPELCTSDLEDSILVNDDYFLGIGDDDPAHFGSTWRKAKLDPGDTATYTFTIRYDTSQMANDYEELDIGLSFYAYPYFDRWLDLIDTEETEIGVDPHSIPAIIEVNLQTLKLGIYKRKI